MEDKLIIWLDDRYCLARNYKTYFIEKHECCCISWKIISQTGTYTICSSIYRTTAKLCLIAAESAEKSLNDNFIDLSIKTDFCWLFSTTTFKWDIETCKFKISDVYCADEFTFPLKGVKALIGDMVIILKELKWID